MTITQLSVFIENKAGTLSKVLRILEKARIQLIACTIADTVDYGICRMLCSEPKRAYLVLKEAGLAVAVSDVFAIELDNAPGKGAEAIALFAEADIEITYLYSFIVNSKGILVFKTDNPDKAKAIVSGHNLSVVSEEALAGLAG